MSKIISIEDSYDLGGIVKVGCFDILHIGHVKMFQRCKEICNKLIVLLGSDDLISKTKRKPFFDQINRAEMLENIDIIDNIIIIDEEDHSYYLSVIKPLFYHLPDDDKNLAKKINMLSSMNITPIIDSNTVLMNYNNLFVPHSTEIINLWT